MRTTWANDVVFHSVLLANEKIQQKQHLLHSNDDDDDDESPHLIHRPNVSLMTMAMACGIGFVYY